VLPPPRGTIASVNGQVGQTAAGGGSSASSPPQHRRLGWTSGGGASSGGSSAPRRAKPWSPDRPRLPPGQGRASKRDRRGPGGGRQPSTVSFPGPPNEQAAAHVVAIRRHLDGGEQRGHLQRDHGPWITSPPRQAGDVGQRVGRGGKADNVLHCPPPRAGQRGHRDGHPHERGQADPVVVTVGVRGGRLHRVTSGSTPAIRSWSPPARPASDGAVPPCGASGAWARRPGGGGLAAVDWRRGKGRLMAAPPVISLSRVTRSTTPGALSVHAVRGISW